MSPNRSDRDCRGGYECQLTGSRGVYQKPDPNEADNLGQIRICQLVRESAQDCSCCVQPNTKPAAKPHAVANTAVGTLSTPKPSTTAR
ncbi:MAG: hypothetical protein AAGA54_21380 [Myxococcota bacterium]